MTVLAQEDFGGGIFRDLRAPRGSVYDALDAIVDDDGATLMRRGGVTYKSLSAPSLLRGLAEGYPFTGRRTVAVGADHNVYVLNGDDSTWTQLPPPLGSMYPRTLARGVGVGDFMVWPNSTPGFVAYAGSRRAGAQYTAGSVTISAGSSTVTGSGTAFLANVGAGDLFTITGSTLRIIASVDSDTQLTLSQPADGAPGGAYVIRSLDGLLAGSMDSKRLTPVSWAVAAVGSPPKLVLCLDNRAYMSDAGKPFTFKGASGAVTEYHELPPGERIVGADGIGDMLVLFSTDGVWTATNLEFDLTDDAGNPQQQLAHVSKDVLLWGESGLAAWASQLLVPALDDVYLFSPGSGPVPISRGIRQLYRSYVASGFRPGIGCVHRGHYFLPILDAATLVYQDALVCRLDQRDSRGNLRPAWTRWTNLGRSAAYVQRVPATAGTGASLLAIGADRVTDMTRCLAPAAGAMGDANGLTSNLDVTLNDADTGPGNRNTVTKIRVRYELAASGGGVLQTMYYVGPDGVSATPLAPDGPVSDGAAPAQWRVAKRCRRIRVRVRSSGDTATLRLRGVEYHVRSSNRP